MKELVIPNCTPERLLMLRNEIGKVRCWLTGFSAGRYGPTALQMQIPAEDSLRQVQILFDDILRGAEGKPAKAKRRLSAST